MTLLPMPDVFVYPPEEDDCPPFCCFDAAQSKPSNSPTQADLDAPGSALDFVSQAIHYDTPAFYRKDIDSPDVIMPRRRNPIIKHYEEQDHPDNDITIRGSSPGNDSEIVEVVKVRRRNETVRTVSDSTLKQSKGLKARASRAFSTLRKVGRSASRTSNKSEEEPVATSTRTPSPTPIPRKPSMVLASLFTRSPSLRSSASFESFNEQAVPSTPTSPISHRSSAETALCDTIHTPASGDMHNFVPYTSDSEDDDNEDEVNTGPDDPQLTPRATQSQFTSPNSRSSQAGRRRFSVMNLFSSFSASESSPSTIPSSPSTPVLPLMSRDSLGPSSDSCESSSSSASSTGPPTPVEETFSPLQRSRSSGGSLLQRLPSLTKKKENRRGSLSEAQPAVAPLEVITGKSRVLEDIEDVSLGEMRLDSLHFSELSFDAEKF